VSRRAGSQASPQTTDPDRGLPGASPTRAEALVRMAAAEDTIRAIGAGEVDGFVISGAGPGGAVFTLATADRPYRMFVENMRDGAATLSAGGLILYANRRLAQLLSTSREAIVGTPLAAFIPGGVPLAQKDLRGADGLGSTLELELVGASGARISVLVGSSPLKVDGGRLTCLTFTDLTVQKAQDQEIARLGRAQAERLTELQAAQVALTVQATHDALTGLPNRQLLVDRIGQALSQAERSGRWIAVLFVDLDHFKQINDTQGHAAGDAVLRSVAERLTAVLRPMDTVARIGGDEFAILAPDVDSHQHAIDVSTRVLAELCPGSPGTQDGPRIGASVGLSVCVAGRGTAEGMISEADMAMYLAKSRGGGRSEHFDAALGRRLRRRASAQLVLESALDERRIVAHYQPIVDLATGDVAAFEALARIAQPDGSILPPAAFVPVAEESGQVLELGAQVLELACREARAWTAPGTRRRPLSVAVNLSARQFEPGNLTALLLETLQRTGLDPSGLQLELTETAVIGLHVDVLQQLGRIRDLGIEIGLDDFGTGYASLTHLRRLPLSFIKIDRTFVQGLGADREDQGIVSAVIDLARNLGLRSIAEGVETDEQLDLLRRLGCDQAQGYLFARPLPPDEISTTNQLVPR
jgi:diguanylate cyclase (GGDEF)-like protein